MAAQPPKANAAKGDAPKVDAAKGDAPKRRFYEIHEIVVPHIGHVPIYKGDFHRLPPGVQDFVAEQVEVCKPRALYLCDGSQEEADEVVHKLIERGTLARLPKLENCYICRTDPADVARVESKTWISSSARYNTVPHIQEGVKGILGQWKSYDDMQVELDARFPGCMSGRIMYVIPFSMGPIGSPLSKIGVQITDSNYVLLCMRVMTRVSREIWDVLGDNGEFVQCLHSMGCPRPVTRKVVNHWPCNPEKILIAHFPEKRKVASYGSGYGGNSLLGKKCFALRIASVIARDEGWLAEHMLIMSVTDPKGREAFIAAAFPSACGKTNLAMIQAGLPKFKVQCIGDDIAWMRFDAKGVLRAINPENGFFGVAPGTNEKTNPNAMATFQKNSIFTNVAETADGGYYWEGMEDVVDKNMSITTWLGEQWRIGMPGKAAHPNSRFCCPASQCPIMHKDWEAPDGVPISALVFGGRRPTVGDYASFETAVARHIKYARRRPPLFSDILIEIESKLDKSLAGNTEGVPLVVEAFDWPHGVMLGACVKSEATAAAEYRGKKIMHDPMAMRPFMGYNFGHYMQHWLDMDKPGRKMPKIFHVNWFRTTEEGDFLWPGFGENIRVLDWILRRCRNEDIAENSAIGLLPKKGSIDLTGLDEIKWDELFSIPTHYWLDDVRESRSFFLQQVGYDLPKVIAAQLDEQEQRIMEG